ncbi:MAG: PDZ domain-containing protein, partial [Candidatus Angelobacter sp.]
ACPAARAAQPQPDPQAKAKTQVYLLASAGRSYLGVDIRDITPDRVAPLKLKEERGVEITMVDGDAPAGKAGLREHDVILSFNGEPVESEEQLRRLIRETPPGRTVGLGISRDGNPLKVSVQLADHGKVVAEAFPRAPLPPRVPDFNDLPNRMDIPMFTIYSSNLGMQTENLTRQLGAYFGIKDGDGVLVRNVERGSAAEKAGIKAGDVIVKVGDEKLSDRTDLVRILRKHRDGGKLTVSVLRDKREQTLTLDVPQRGPRDSSTNVLDLDDLKSELGEISTLGPEIAMTNTLQELKSMQSRHLDYDEQFRDLNRQLQGLDKLLQGSDWQRYLHPML